MTSRGFTFAALAEVQKAIKMPKAKMERIAFAPLLPLPLLPLRLIMCARGATNPICRGFTIDQIGGTTGRARTRPSGTNDRKSLSRELPDRRNSLPRSADGGTGRRRHARSGRRRTVPPRRPVVGPQRMEPPCSPQHPLVESGLAPVDRC